jgi:hypothetical protein
MQHLEGSGTPVLYIGRKVLKGLLVKRAFFLLKAGNTGFYSCTSCIICYHATQTAAIFHNLKLFCTPFWIWLSYNSQCHKYFAHSFPFHVIFHFQLV